MKKFIKGLGKFSLIGIIPMLILFSGYVYFDPFKVLRDYKDYSYPEVTINRDYVSTTMFMNNHKKNNYNSFIFGSSRTLAFKPNSWTEYLPSKSSPFMFDASGESIYGIYIKIKYLDSINVKIDNALILLCRDNYTESHKGHLFIKHPIISGTSNFSFQSEFFKAYLNPKFLFNFLSYKSSNTFKPYMSNYIENHKITFDIITNEINILEQEEEITRFPTEYYIKRKNLFYERGAERIDAMQRITKKHIFMLNEIKRILEKHHTTYKVVLSPLYEQIKFHNLDLLTLQKIFGDHLYDFSGKNPFTDNKKNYYEKSHFRTNVGDSILKHIYK